MVAFTKLGLTGFKSFVDPTELEIEPGLTGVVGPNGCGKSNLVEALRWVMGETSAKQMRGGEMEQVIFGGTRDRPARNIAEVRLHLDNAERDAPTVFNTEDELEISRRIERDRGSDYRVNGKDVRAKDVQLLFADMASGARSTALVSQGRIGEIINSKPQARRHLLEEAAAITGLHTRRHEAELRLKGAETNLERLDDVIQALDVQLDGLKKQARQATRYRNLSDNIRAADALVLLLKWRAAETRHNQAKEALSAFEQVFAEATRVLAAATAAHEQTSESLPPLRDADARTSAALQRLVNEDERLEDEAQRVASDIEDHDIRLEQIFDDIGREKERQADAVSATDQLSAEQARLNAEAADVEESAAQAKTDLERATASVRDSQGKTDSLASQLASLRAQRQSLDRQLSDIRGRLERLAQRSTQVKADLDALAPSEHAQRQLSEARAAVTQAEEASESARQSLIGKETATANLQEDLTDAVAQVRDAEANHTRITAELQALAALLRDTAQDTAPVLDEISVTPGYEAALAAALGEDLEAGLDPAAARHWRTMGADSSLPLPAGTRSLAELVAAPAALQKRLSQIAVVDEDADAETAAATLQQGQRLVSKAGSLWRWDGFVARAGQETAEAAKLKQRNRAAELEAELPESERLLSAAQSKAEELNQSVSAARQAELDARQQVKQADDDLQMARSREAQAQREVEAQDSRRSALKDSLAQLSGETEELQAEETTAADALAAVPTDSELEQDLDQARAALSAAREAELTARSAFDGLAQQARARSQRLGEIERELQSWQDRRAAGERQLDGLFERQTTIESALADLKSKPEELDQARAALGEQKEKAEAERKSTSDALAEGEAKFAHASATLRDAEQTHASAREERVRKESAVEQADQAIVALRQTIGEHLDCNPDSLPEIAKLKEGAEPPALEDAERRLERLQRERENMGAINLRAEQEAEELMTQIDGLNTEREDLLGAIERLREGIAELNREGRQRLMASFREVDEHFRELFTHLFGGGRAHLSLTNTEDPLQAGLEIMASPPGKRLQSLSLLSGGEQALTAVALLFAVFLTNPAPICVLDEVDAPLDDSNVDRFCNLLNRLTDMTSTRFLIVTHHRMTMARMDRLYGVTMAERGVSQLVSVDLKTAEELRDSA